MQLIAGLALAAVALAGDAGWPKGGRETRPWAYWWWHGSAVDKDNLTREMERYRQAGMGGVHIVPIFGTKGAEARDIEYLSPKWMEMFAHAVKEGARLDFGVDMTTGTGWCFGGPMISPEQASGVAVAGRGPDGAWRISMKPTIRVKRASPGGEGPMLNPFYRPAVETYLQWFERGFPAGTTLTPRAMYHDSFEYQVNWSPDLPQEFAKRRGYPLESVYDAIFGNDASDRTARAKGDYRETLAELLRENLLEPWVRWAKARGIRTRNQAHGSPGNLLDLYAAADIPETEMFNKDRSTLVSKMASSAAHVTGKPLVSAEFGTWLKEHWQETLADLKELADQLYLAGVNHLFYHGTCYSPGDAAWPGWLFYASTEMNPRNPIWRDAPALNAYFERAQSLLQTSKPDNDVLVYWPIHDAWHDPKGMTIAMTVHNRGWLETQPVGRLAQRLYERGYSFDFVSDLQLALLKPRGKRLEAPGGSYAALVVPRCDHLPVDTAQRLAALAKAGAAVIFEDRPPSDVPGLKDLEKRQAELRAALAGAPVQAGEVEALLAKAGAAREESMDQPGVFVLRKRGASGLEYFVANRGAAPLDGWVKFAKGGARALLMDPLSGRTGTGAMRKSGAGAEVYLQLAPGETVFVRLGAAVSKAMWPYRRDAGASEEIRGTWDVRFVAGGPDLPAAARVARLESWTRFAGEPAVRFGGTAVYSLQFDSKWKEAVLDLGAVKESARVRLSGFEAGVLIGAPYRLRLEGLKPTGNLLEIEVTNLAANRIRDLDRRKIEWRIFKDINLVNLDYKPFDASSWEVRDSGLLGPVVLRETAVLAPGR
jgi:hypothetical protein